MKNVLNVICLLICVLSIKAQSVEEGALTFKTYYGGYLNFNEQKFGKVDAIMNWTFDVKNLQVKLFSKDRNIDESYPIYSVYKQLNLSGESKSIYVFKCGGKIEFRVCLFADGTKKVVQTLNKDRSWVDGVDITNRLQIFTDYIFDDVLKESNK